MEAAIRFYLDENLPIAIGEQLRRRGIDAVTVRDLDLLGESDESHLQRAATMAHVLCTHDADYVEMASSGTDHAGIIFGQQHQHGMGEWVKFIELVHGVNSRKR